MNEGALSFSYRTSSEAGYDGMVFFMDGTAKASWSGINPWTFYHEPISEGSHTLEWRYLKDPSDSFGLDQA